MISSASQQFIGVMPAFTPLPTSVHSAPSLLGVDVMQLYANLGVDRPASEPLAVKSGSARRKLWNLSPTAVAPLIGICLPFHEVQKIVAKVELGVDPCPDYDLHCRVVQECCSRNALSELVQRELDSRFALSIQQSQHAKTTPALAQWWDEASAGADWAGEFWAVLTHPRCSADLESIVLGQVHMAQLQLGSAARSQAKSLAQVMAQNQRLTQDLATAQQRLQSLAAEHALAVAGLQAEGVKLRGQVIRAKTERDLAQAQSRDTKAPASDVQPFARLAEEYSRLLARNQRLRLRSLRRGVDSATQSSAKVVADRGDAEHSAGESSADTRPVLDLQQRAVLCVGGRTQGIPVYREVIENRGARFTHHDGGEEEKAGRLEHQLQAADLVICQVGCISHSAYWRVKAHCKRTGKPCLFVEMPSRSALERALGQAVSEAEESVPLGQQLCNA